MTPRATGAIKSPYDIRTFAYPTTGTYIYSGGERYEPEDIEDQSKEGICTSIHLTQNARKATGIPYSADFQYLMQKREIDSKLPIGWDEGSSIFSAVKIAQTVGLLPEEHWTHTTQADRDLPYDQYIAKLRAIPDSEIERLKGIASAYKIKAYASVPVDRDSMAEAISNSKAGILTRFVVGNEWWTNPIEPLRSPKSVISGHAITTSNFAGGSFRVANTWGSDWADKGTAYYLFNDYRPTECWAVFYNEVPPVIDQKLANRTKVIGQIMDYLQKIIALLPQLA